MEDRMNKIAIICILVITAIILTISSNAQAKNNTRIPDLPFRLQSPLFENTELVNNEISNQMLSTFDLSINMTDRPDPVYAGDNVTYTITVENLGPDDATYVDVTDNLPGNIYY